MNIKKTIQRSEECFIQFTQDELKQLNIEAGDKFTWEMQDDGSCLLHKCVPIEINLSEYSREVLEMVISESIEKGLPVDDVMCNIIEEYIATQK